MRTSQPGPLSHLSTSRAAAGDTAAAARSYGKLSGEGLPEKFILIPKLYRRELFTQTVYTARIDTLRHTISWQTGTRRRQEVRPKQPDRPVVRSGAGRTVGTITTQWPFCTVNDLNINIKNILLVIFIHFCLYISYGKHNLWHKRSHFSLFEVLLRLITALLYLQIFGLRSNINTS